MWLFGVFIITAGITAFYTMRMLLLTFFGDYRGHGHPHEAPPTMTGPLVFLALCTVGVGLLGSPQLGSVFGDWVFFEHPHEGTFVAWIALLGTLVAVGGLALGYVLYRQHEERDPMESALGPMWNVLQNRYYIDAFYMRAIIYPTRDTLSAAVYWTNQHILDAIVNGAAALARVLSRAVMWFDRNVIDGFVNGLGETAGSSGGLLKQLQSGNVQWYAVGLFVGVIALAIVFIRIA
jgi:NADH-quinone oxidoreductase subunit L